MIKLVNAEILAIGDELLYGQIQDTNSLWISQELDKIGVKVVRRTTVGDNREAMLHAFVEAEKAADIILITGGLGPTHDDLTKPLLAEYFGCELALVPEALEAVRQLFEKRGRELTPTNRLQAHLPTKCQYVPNKLGTAPGMWFEENGKVWMSMPGVPHEMKGLMNGYVLPKIKQMFDLPVIYHKLVKTVGIGESWLSDLIKEWEESLPDHVRLAYLPSLGEVKLRLTAIGNTFEEAENEVDIHLDKLLPKIGKYIYGYNQDQLHSVVGHLLSQKGESMALAESCSGGYIAHLITSISGSSAYFRGGMIPYHNEIKEKVLGVGGETLQEHGAVSEATVMEMAACVKEKFRVDYGLSSSGIAGPEGGTPDKPVGTVWIACAHKSGVETKHLKLTQDRAVNIHLTAVSALNLLRKCILGDFD
ncbi:competence/damage-inducible protein A [Pleomorphovibrio marinus]|uniref:competence/damage-inducible protein A n=1 Tax=Pleomorphovibrio marinus TaxID=2164132 RepID=UPI000E0ACD43|nr:competence/damage-inducible protein A [Pleomorphovibrio marinus]